MNILFTNDDGYDSVLLQALYSYCVDTFKDSNCLLVAPKDNQSGIAHAISLQGSLKFQKKDKNKIVVHGYPADCIILGEYIFGPIDLVISGPNLGSNLGQDIMYSGTVAASREAAMKSIPSIACSITDDGDHDPAEVDMKQLHAFWDKWLIPFITLAKRHTGKFININISNPISLEVKEGVLSHRHYNDYDKILSVQEEGEHTHEAIQKMGVDHSKAPLNSDWKCILDGYSVFNILSVWPDAVSGLYELYSYLEQLHEN